MSSTVIKSSTPIFLLLNMYILSACDTSKSSLIGDSTPPDSRTENPYSQGCPLEGMSSEAHQFSSSIHEESFDSWELFAYSTPTSTDAVEVELFDGETSATFALEQKESDSDNDLWYRLINSPIDGLDDGQTSVTFWFKLEGEIVDCSVNVNHFSNTED